MYELRIDPDLRNLTPHLNNEEQQMLEDSIVRNGMIVDGHNRYALYRG